MVVNDFSSWQPTSIQNERYNFANVPIKKLHDLGGVASDSSSQRLRGRPGVKHQPSPVHIIRQLFWFN